MQNNVSHRCIICHFGIVGNPCKNSANEVNFFEFSIPSCVNNWLAVEFEFFDQPLAYIKFMNIMLELSEDNNCKER